VIDILVQPNVPFRYHYGVPLPDGTSPFVDERTESCFIPRTDRGLRALREITVESRYQIENLCVTLPPFPVLLAAKGHHRLATDVLADFNGLATDPRTSDLRLLSAKGRVLAAARMASAGVHCALSVHRYEPPPKPGQCVPSAGFRRPVALVLNQPPAFEAAEAMPQANRRVLPPPPLLGRQGPTGYWIEADS